MNLNLLAFHSMFFLLPAAKRLQQRTKGQYRQEKEEEELTVDNQPREVLMK